MNKFPLISLAGAALLALGSVHAPAAEWAGATERRGAAPVTWDDLEHTQWIADGRDDAPRKVYVFMDANCKYCTKFWSDARPWVRSGKVQLRHIMVAVIAPSSAGKAAALMVDPDPARRLSSFEEAHAFGVARMLAGGTRHSLEDPNLQPLQAIPPEVGRSLVDHERLMLSLGLQGTPGIVFRGLNGQLVARPGIPPGELPTILGALQAP
jgi:thiol:disulfide interchange protein DsbG